VNQLVLDLLIKLVKQTQWFTPYHYALIIICDIICFIVPIADKLYDKANNCLAVNDYDGYTKYYRYAKLITYFIYSIIIAMTTIAYLCLQGVLH